MKLAKNIILPTLAVGADKFSLSDCPENGLRCTRDYKPVCGDDGQTYGNACMAHFFFCNRRQGLTEVAYDGECLEETEEPCETPCTRDYDPVCGSDGRTYPNDCVLKNANCLSSDEILKVRQGPCPENFMTTKNVPNVADCPLKCQNGTKVCGSDGNTYNSMCHLKRANCASNQLITRAHQGKCEKKMVNDSALEKDCPSFCNRMLVPVCGNDYVTYGNECSLKMSACADRSRNLLKLHDGRCECPETCSKSKNQVCASNGKTYSSPCELKRAACDSGELISIKSFGKCHSATLIEGPDVNLKNGKQVKPRLKNGRKNKSCHCPNHFKQVCGVNGKTYNNECMAECDGVEIVQNCSCREGPCPSGLWEVLNDFGMNFEEIEEEEEPEEELELFETNQRCDENIPAGECRAACPRIFKYTCTYSVKTGYKGFANECERDFFSCTNKIGLCPAVESVCATYEKELEDGGFEEVSEWFSDGCRAIEAGAIISNDERLCGENMLNDYGMLFDIGFGNDFFEPEEPEDNPKKKNNSRKNSPKKNSKKDEALKPVATKQVGSGRKNGGKNNNIWNNISQWGFYGRKKRATQN